MKYAIRQTSRYKKSLKKMLKRGKDINKITAVVQALAMGETLPPQYKDHALSGDLEGLRDCHIENDSRCYAASVTPQREAECAPGKKKQAHDRCEAQHKKKIGSTLN